MKQYLIDRGNNLADCFTIIAGRSIGLGAGLKVTNYLGHVTVGAGIGERKFGYYGRDWVEYKSGWVGVPVLQIGVVASGTYQLCTDSKKCKQFAYELATLLMLSTGFVFHGGDIAESYSLNILGLNFIDEIISICELSPFAHIPFARRKFFIEASLTLGYIGFDIGFNPVEFVDFLLGIFTIDILGDDGCKYFILDSAEAYFSRAEIRRKTGDIEGAFQDYKQVLDVKKGADPFLIRAAIRELLEIDGTRAAKALSEMMPDSFPKNPGDILEWYEKHKEQLTWDADTKRYYLKDE